MGSPNYKRKINRTININIFLLIKTQQQDEQAYHRMKKIFLIFIRDIKNLFSEYKESEINILKKSAT